jgi:glutamate racemase
MGKGIVFLDSGIGGLPYAKQFMKRNPHKKIIYVADNKNFPYGEKSKNELIEILFELVSKIIRTINPKMIILACNTASVSALQALRKKFSSLVFVGTVPAVKPAILNSKAAHIGVLGTLRTIDDPYIDELALGTGKPCKITRIAAPTLIDFIENRFIGATSDEKMDITKSYVQKFNGADAIVLGCTHFLFLQDEFKIAAAPDIKIYDSVDGVCRHAEALLGDCDDAGLKNILYVTGGALADDAKKKWLCLAGQFDFNLQELG